MALLATVIAMMAFCGASAPTYLVNDLADIDTDTFHPTKPLRPIAAGTLSAAGHVVAHHVGFAFAAIATTAVAISRQRFRGLVLDRDVDDAARVVTHDRPIALASRALGVVVLAGMFSPGSRARWTIWSRISGRRPSPPLSISWHAPPVTLVDDETSSGEPDQDWVRRRMTADGRSRRRWA